MADATITAGYSALSGGAGLTDLSTRGRIRVTGEDRARLLHAMTTNHVQQMKPGDGIYAFFLNAQGRIQADAYILCFEDRFLLDTEPETRETLFAHLDKFIIADDVTLDDVTSETLCLGLEGPNSAEIAAAAGLPAPHHRYSHLEWEDAAVAAISGTGHQGVRIYAPAARRDEIVQRLEGAGAVAASAEDVEAVRIRNFHPRFGVDFTESTLPQETQLMHALHFQKGCYLGQEIVERIRSRGHVNKQLMGFRMDGHSVPSVGANLFAGGKEVGEVTSCTAAPGDGLVEPAVFGLAYVRVPYNKPGTVAGIDGRPAELFAPLA
jgi:folate-binding protein YgfZ